jgi:hypothetical protein
LVGLTAEISFAAVVAGLDRGLKTTAPFLLRWGTSQKGRAVFRREDRWALRRDADDTRVVRNTFRPLGYLVPGFFEKAECLVEGLCAEILRRPSAASG